MSALLPSFVVPTYSPGYIGRGNRRFEGIVLHDLQRAVKLRDGWRPKWDRSKYILKPTLARVLAALKSMTSSKARVAYDIETNGQHPLICQVRCIAFYDGKTNICIPFEYRDGTTTDEVRRTKKGKTKTKKIANWKPYWSAENLKIVLAAMAEMFNTAQLDTQNGQYDRLCMRAKFGIVIPSANVTGNFDTILGHHIVSSYMPHGLGFLASVYTEAPYYKSTDSGSAWSSSSDHDLWRYCLRGDVPVEMADGTTRTIESLVRTKSTAKVLAFNERTQKMEHRRITGWHRNRVPGQKWIQLKTSTRRGIVLTPDHKVLVEERGWVEAEKVLPGNQLLLPEEQLTSDQLHALMGTLLGDSTISVAPEYRGKSTFPKAAIHGAHRLDTQLTQEKVRLLGKGARIGCTQPAKEVRISGRVGQGREALKWNTLSLHQFAAWRERLHPVGGKKRLPLDFVQEMGSIGWAWWFMDDGCVQKGGKKSRNTGARGGREFGRDTICLSTQGFPRADVQRVVVWMSTFFGPTSAGADNVIRMGVQASQQFCTLIAPYVFPAQRYKLPRETHWEPYRDFNIAPTARPVRVAVLVAAPWTPPMANRFQRLRAETRFCIDVEKVHNFFTPQGLVHNCCDDVVVTRDTATQIRQEIHERKEDVILYDHDSWQEQECQRWRYVGIQVDRRAVALLQKRYGEMRDKALAAMRAALLKQSKRKVETPELAELLDRLGELQAVEDDSDEDEKGNSTNDDGIHLFNPASLRQLRLLLTHLGVPLSEETATGEISTAKEFLLGARKQLYSTKASAKKNAAAIEFLDFLFAWREASKLYSTYLHPEILPDGRVHANYNVHVVPTGRLSSSGPNFQNQPAEVRGMFTARDAWHVLVAGDWDALEMRLGGLASGDKTFIDDFDKYDRGVGPKVHISNMIAIFGMEAQWAEQLKLSKGDEVAAGAVLAERFPGCYRAAKVFAYAAAYGAGPITVFEKVREEMPDMDFTTFQLCFARYKKYRHQLFDFQAGVVKLGTQQQYLDSPILKRRVHFFERVFGTDSPEASAMQNMPYQSGGSDCVSLANRRLMEQVVIPWRKTKLKKKGDKVKIGKKWTIVPVDEVLEQLAQVHDELLFEVPARLAEEFAAEFKRVVEQPVDELHKHWKLPVDVKVKKPVREGAPSRWKPLHYPAPCCDKEAVVEVLNETDGSVVWSGDCENKKCKQHAKEFTVAVPSGVSIGGAVA